MSARGFLGGTNYLVPSYDKSTHTAYISGNYWCETIKGTPIQPWAPFKAYVYAEFHMHVMPGHSGGGGFIKAIDVTNGKTRWEHDMVDANWSGLVATAGGVLFGGGTDTRDFFALDKATGKKLWSFRTNSGMVGAPITYEIDGVQYVAVVCWLRRCDSHLDRRNQPEVQQEHSSGRRGLGLRPQGCKVVASSRFSGLLGSTAAA